MAITLNGMRMDENIKGHLFNLIIYTQDERRSKYAKNLVHTLVERYPSRVIHIEAQTERKNDQQLEISQRNCEQLTISSSLSSLDEVPFIVLPYLIADLPIYLFWGDDPTASNPILPKLEKLANRIIFDSECTADLQEFTLKMLNKISKLDIEFMDISWAQISGWRDVVSQVFNDAAQLDYLNNCNEIEIKYNQLDDPYIEHDSVQAIYLQGWLSAQLNWEFDSLNEINETHIIRYINRTITLSPQKRPTLPPGQIFEIGFKNSNGLETTLTFADQQSKVMVYVSTPDHCYVPYSLQLQLMQKGMTAMKEMFYFNPSHHYKNMLRSISKIPWKHF